MDLLEKQARHYERQWLSEMLTATERLRLLLQYATPEIAELGSAGAALLYGGWLLVTGPYLVRTYPHFWRPMEALFPSQVWAGVMVLAGLAQAWQMLLGSKSARRGSALFAASIWLFIAANWARADVHAPVIGLFLGSALMSVWAHIRLNDYWLPDPVALGKPLHDNDAIRAADLQAQTDAET